MRIKNEQYIEVLGKSAGLCGTINIWAKTCYYICICIHYL